MHKLYDNKYFRFGALGAYPKKVVHRTQFYRMSAEGPCTYRVGKGMGKKGQGKDLGREKKRTPKARDGAHRTSSPHSFSCNTHNVPRLAVHVGSHFYPGSLQGKVLVSRSSVSYLQIKFYPQRCKVRTTNVRKNH